MKITKTDHHEQSLVLFPHIICLIREGMEAITNDNRLSSILRDDALELKRFIESPDTDDKPAIFQRSHGNMIKCPDCGGTRTQKIMPDDRDAEVEFVPCKTCEGDGQLYSEVIRKMYVPTDQHRRKLAR